VATTQVEVKIREADWNDPKHGAGLIDVLDSYARGESGGFAPLSDEVKRRLVPALAEQTSALVLLAFVDHGIVGVATCFYGFSTFAARPLLNVHDLAVLPAHRGCGIGRALLSAAEERARARGCVKLTLEVLETNHGARRLYESFGFRDFELAGAPLRTHFLSKTLGA
jgi:GNAT superfamily N-acetyltransferase